PLHNSPDAAGRQARSPACAQVHHQRTGIDLRGFARRAQTVLAPGQVAADGERRLVAQRDVALLATLAADENCVVLPLNIGHVDADELRVADTAAVQQLEDHAIALRPCDGIAAPGARLKRV